MNALIRRYFGTKFPKGSTVWMVVTGLGIFVRLLRWMAKRPVETLFREDIKSGESMTIQLLDAANSKATRKAVKIK